MSFVCTHCDKDKKNKYNLNSHLYVTTNKCSMKQIKLDNEYNINEVKEKMLELMEEKVNNVKRTYDKTIEDFEKKLKDKDWTLEIALRESDYHIKSKEEQIIKLENHIKEMTKDLINKPTTQYIMNVNKTAEDYMKTKKGIYLNVLQCLKPKESKKIDLLILNGNYDNYKNYNYYNLLCSLIGQNCLLENIVVKDMKRGKVLIRYNNKTEELSKNNTPFETSYELGKINDYIRGKVEQKYKKFILSNEFYINNLRLSLSKKGNNNRIWGDIKNNMVLSLQ